MAPEDLGLELQMAVNQCWGLGIEPRSSDEQPVLLNIEPLLQPLGLDDFNLSQEHLFREVVRLRHRQGWGLG